MAIRDPVHKWIKFTEAERAVIDHPYVQRLRWISQLTSVSDVYPGGTNTRFAHSLGAMYLAGKYMKSLLKNFTGKDNKDQNSAKCIQIARLAALLHDIGHGPFSHAYDRAVYTQIYPDAEKGHDEHRLK